MADLLADDLHDHPSTVRMPLNRLSEADLGPGAGVPEALSGELFEAAPAPQSPAVFCPMERLPTEWEAVATDQ